MRKLLFLLGLIAFVLLAIYCVYSHKLTIQDDIQNRVSQNLAGVTSGNITASTSGRDVTLTGHVDTQEQKKKIGYQANSVQGVRAIINNLTVTPAQVQLEPTLKPTDFGHDLGNMETLDVAPMPEKVIEPAEILESVAPEPAQEILVANDRCQKDIAEIMEGEVIRFTTGSTTIDAPSLRLIKRIAEAAENCPSAEALVVHGHTDNVGNAKSNMDLSVKRAVAVGQQLKKAGVEQRVDGVGHGDLNPIASNDNAQGRAQNRRIEFKVK